MEENEVKKKSANKRRDMREKGRRKIGGRKRKAIG
jgi:hypothetical protein